jgi:hypothetical protein
MHELAGAVSSAEHASSNFDFLRIADCKAKSL